MPQTALFITSVDLSKQSGVQQKIVGQVAGLEQVGLSVDLVYCDSRSIYKNGEAVASLHGPVKNLLLSLLPRPIRRLFQFRHFFDVIKDHTYDIIFIRYQRSSQSFLSLLKKIRSSNPDGIILIEVVTYPYKSELKKLTSKFIYLVDWVFRRCMKNYVDYILTYSDHSQIFSIPTIKVENGIDVDNITLDNISVDYQRELHLLAIANVSFWHGYDRLLQGLANWNIRGEKPKVYFHIVGEGRALNSLRFLTSRKKLDHLVFYHGGKFDKELDAIVKRCHIGVGVLGGHRKNLETSSSLKAREYCCRGLPFIMTLPDRDFDSFPFSMMAPADESPINIEEVVRFYHNLSSNNPNWKNEMRTFAENNLSWRNKMSSIIDCVLSSTIKTL